MNANEVLLLVLAAACIVLAATQAAELRGRLLLLTVIALAAGLFFMGEMASRTSLAEVGQWLADPQRRLDLAALLLLEALLFGSQAVAMVQGRAGLLWRVLGSLPPPSLLITLFLAQVMVMLSVDGIDYDLLTWLCAIVFAFAFGAGTFLLGRLLPDALMRSGLRIMLYGVQATVGLWLSRPAQAMPDDFTPAMWDRLGLLAVMMLSVLVLGWFWQRRFNWNG